MHRRQFLKQHRVPRLNSSRVKHDTQLKRHQIMKELVVVFSLRTAQDRNILVGPCETM